MATTWTSEHVLDFAPDEASARAAHELADAHKWIALGHDASAAWGEYQGSAETPYQVLIDLDEPTFHCTCPSRKYPCKHTLGLFLLYIEQSGAFADEPLPAWAAEWLLERSEQTPRRRSWAKR